MRRREFIALAATAWPLAVRAQQPGRTYRLAVVHGALPVAALSAASSPPSYGAFFDELGRRGYVEGQNLVVERYSASGKDPEGQGEALRAIAAGNPDVIFATAMDTAVGATPVAVPLVHMGLDPIGFRLTSSLAHPDRNITGVVVIAGREIYAKQFQLLREAVPSASRIGCLTVQQMWDEAGADVLGPLRQAAQQARTALIPAIVKAPSDDDAFRAAFAAMAEQRADALIVSQAIVNIAHQKQIVALAAGARLPAIYPERGFAERGDLISYGSIAADRYRRAADDVAQLLAGAKPADIPFYQASRFELVVNLKTAQALGLTIPPVLQTGADDVIE